LLTLYLIYHFAATSNGSMNGIDNTDGGACIKNNMRLIIKVLGWFFSDCDIYS